MRAEAGGGAEAEAEARRKGPVMRPLSTSLLWLTMLAVMAAEVLIFVPSVADFRREWLRQKLDSAAVAGLTVERPAAGGEPALGPDQQAALLDALDAHLVAIGQHGVSRLLAREEEVPPLDRQVDLGRVTTPGLILGAFDTLLFGGERTLRVTGPIGEEGMTAEVVIPERKLRRAMLDYARNIFALSLVIALFAALLVYAAISHLLVRPIRAMTQAMVRFGEAPTDTGRIIAPSGRPDEIGVAEAELAVMQATLSQTLREQRHLADLGLAVSKINHDLRNILASAQLVSDRLADVPDPRVQRTLPLLLRSLDRALSYTRSVLSYGRAVESPPSRRRVNLQRLAADVFTLLAVAPDGGIELVNRVPEDLEADIDPDQLFRTLTNLCRNAVQALEGEAGEALVRRVAVDGRRETDGTTLLFVEDTGPGLPPQARANLFQAFRGSTRAGGTGLGLAIAAEIVEAHGGTLTLDEAMTTGTRFSIRLPQPPAMPPPPSPTPPNLPQA